MNKAVILAAGVGSRMRRADAAAALEPAQAAAADSGMKALVPVPRPFLDYVLCGLADAGIEEVCIVIAPGDNPIRERYATMALRRIRVDFAVQEAPRGSADAALAAEKFVAGADFLLGNSDNYYPVVAYRALRELGEPGLPVFSRETLLERGNVSPERLGRYAAVRVDARGYLERIDEKPAPATLAAGEPRVLVSMNLWRFSAAIFEACRKVPLSARGERELPEAVQLGIARCGLRFRATACAEGILDLSTRADIPAVARRLRDVEVRL